MCLSVPAKILSLNGQKATVEVDKQVREIFLACEGGAPGDWVLLYSGIALCLLDSEAAAETLRLLGKSAN